MFRRDRVLSGNISRNPCYRHSPLRRPGYYFLPSGCFHLADLTINTITTGIVGSGAEPLSTTIAKKAYHFSRLRLVLGKLPPESGSMELRRFRFNLSPQGALAPLEMHLTSKPLQVLLASSDLRESCRFDARTER